MLCHGYKPAVSWLSWRLSMEKESGNTAKISSKNIKELEIAKY